MGNSQGSYETGSKQPINDSKNQEDGPLGIENCSIPAARITASSSTDDGPAFFGRLNGSKSWCAGSPADSFLEVDFDTVHYVSAVATQGNPIGNHDYVKNYKIQYSTNGIDWEFYQENYKQVLEGNTDYNTAVKRAIEPNFKARYVRFWPTAWFQWPCLRVEIYGRIAPIEKFTENGVVTTTADAEETQPLIESDEEDDELDEPEANMDYPHDINEVTVNDEQDIDDVKVTEADENFILHLDTSTPAREPCPNYDVNKVEEESKDQELDFKQNEVNLKRPMEVKTKLEFDSKRNQNNVEVKMRKKKRVTLESEPPEYFYVPRRIHDDMWGDSPMGSFSEGLEKDDKPLIEVQDGGAPLAKHEDDVIEDDANQKTHSITIRTITTITTRVERQVDEQPNIHEEKLVENDRALEAHDKEHDAHDSKHDAHDKQDHEHNEQIDSHDELDVPHKIENVSIPYPDEPDRAHDHDKYDHDEHDHAYGEHDHAHEESTISVTANVSHNAPEDLFLSLNGYDDPMPYAAKASCEHLHPTDPAVQVAMESSFSERVDSMDQINIDALASRRFSGLDLLQSPYDAVSGDDIERLLAWEDDTLPGWTKVKKSRDFEVFKGIAVDGGPPIIKAVITLKKTAYEEAVKYITDWNVRKEWDKTFDKINFIEQSYNFNVLHCAIKKQGLTLAVLDDVDIDEPYHASVWSVADHPDSYSLSPGKPLRYETMISGLIIRPTLDGFPSTRVTLLCQIKGSVSHPLKGTFLTGNPDKWVDMLKKYSSKSK